MKFECCLRSIKKIKEWCTYLNRNKYSNDSHHDILWENTCDVSILIIIYIVKTVTKYYRRWAFNGLKILLALRKSQKLADFGGDSLVEALRSWFLLRSRIQIYLYCFIVQRLQLWSEDISSFPCLYKSSNKVFLRLERLMLESKPRRLNFTLIIKHNIQRVLLSTDAIHLAAIALDLNLCKHLHLLIEW